MKKLTLLLVAVVLLSGGPAFALFTNGGFEDDNFNGWTLTGSGAYLSEVIEAGALQPYQGMAINPYNGDHMARLQDYGGNNHATTLSQSDSVTQGDIDTGAKLYVNWGAVLEEPTNNVLHTVANQPSFDIAIYKNGINVQDFHADAQTKQGGGWVQIDPSSYTYGDFWYKAGTFVFDFSSFVVGDILKIEMMVEDCGLGGHGAYAFLDGIGTIFQPPSTVPEPSTLLLLGGGLVGLAFLRRRKLMK